MASESSHNNVFIYSDSLFALQALSKIPDNIKINPFILDIRRLEGREKFYTYNFYLRYLLYLQLAENGLMDGRIWNDLCKWKNVVAFHLRIAA